MVDNIEYPAQVEGGKYQSHIGRGMSDGTLGHDIIETQLSLDDAIRMFHNRLSLLVQLSVEFDPNGLRIGDGRAFWR